jgi:hypothetical protein
VAGKVPGKHSVDRLLKPPLERSEGEPPWNRFSLKGGWTTYGSRFLVDSGAIISRR